MRIRRLILDNFGLFAGRNEIDLAPRDRYRKTRPVVLIGGTNGAGKTTILEAIRLCLYGSLALGERVSQDEYHSFLRESIHRSGAGILPVRSAAIGLEFEYGIAGRLHQFAVERSWESTSSGISVSLSITRDGVPLDELERAHADEFLRDLIPLGVSQLFFFDGEKIQEIAQASDDDETLNAAIKSLLGLDLVTRLHSDLDIYAARMRRAESPKALKKELQTIDATLEELRQEGVALVRADDQARSTVDRIRRDIAIADRRKAREGGAFATEQEALQVEQAALKQHISSLEQRLRELCADLLPFTFATQLCVALRDQLTAEKSFRDWQIHRTLVAARVQELKQRAESALFAPNDPKSTTSAHRRLIVERAQSLLDAVAAPHDGPSDTELVHRVSEETGEKLHAAIHRVVNDVPNEIHRLEQDLERSMRRLLQVKSALEKIPADDVLGPMVRQLNELHRRKGAAEAEAKRATEVLRSHEHAVEVQRRVKEKKEEDLRAATAANERYDTVESVQGVLREYSAALTQRKLAELGKAVADCFAQLWRKGDVLRQIQIDPESCSIILLDRHDCVIPKDRLSAGERQIYAISILWALARVSGRILPMVIDTPLARLDSKHRQHLVSRYFPHVSHQVIILSTDTEIDQQYFAELRSSVSHAYHLRYDEADGRTAVENGYFWSRSNSEEAVV